MVKRLIRVLALFALLSRVRIEPDEEELTPEEYASLDEALGDALRPDGSIDFDRLREKTIPMDLDKWRREVLGDEPVASERHS